MISFFCPKEKINLNDLIKEYNSFSEFAADEDLYESIYEVVNPPREGGEEEEDDEDDDEDVFSESDFDEILEEIEGEERMQQQQRLHLQQQQQQQHLLQAGAEPKVRFGIAQIGLFSFLLRAICSLRKKPLLLRFAPLFLLPSAGLFWLCGN